MTNNQSSRFGVHVDTLATEGWHRLSLGARLVRCLLPIAAYDEDPARFWADPNWVGDALFPLETEAPIADWLGELDRAEVIRISGDEGVMLQPARFDIRRRAPR